jgi:hypothetical protein
VLSPAPGLLDADAAQAVCIGPGPQLGRGGGQIGPVAEHVAEPVAAADAEVGRVGVGDVVVEVDQMWLGR